MTMRYLLLMTSSLAYSEVSVIPLPREITAVPDESYLLNMTTAVVYSDEAGERPAQMLAEYLRPVTGLPLPVQLGGLNEIRPSSRSLFRKAFHGRTSTLQESRGLNRANRTRLPEQPYSVRACWPSGLPPKVDDDCCLMVTLSRKLSHGSGN